MSLEALSNEKFPYSNLTSQLKDINSEFLLKDSAKCVGYI